MEGHRQSGGPELPDRKRLIELITDFNTARRNVHLYPAGHVQVGLSVERAHQALHRLLQQTTDFTFGAVKDTLIVGKEPLDLRNPSCREFALVLKQNDIAALTFSQGLTQEELSRFLQVLAGGRPDAGPGELLLEVLSRKALPHIRVRTVDYSRFRVTEEEELRRKDPARRGVSVRSLWQCFVTRLVALEFLTADGSRPLGEADLMDPPAVARLVSGKDLDLNTSLRSYGNALRDHAQQVEGRKGPVEPIDLKPLNLFLQELGPQAREQFLATTFQFCSTHGAAAWTELVLGSLDPNLLLGMLQQAAKEERQISPSFLTLLQKIGQIQDTAQPPSPPKDAPRPEEPLSSGTKPEELDSLLRREQYEKYVVSDYAETLKKLARKQTSESAAEAEGFVLEQHIRTLGEEHLEGQIAMALLAFMETEDGPEDYRECAARLTAAIDPLLDSGQFSVLLETLQTLRQHRDAKEQPEIRSHAAAQLGRFEDPLFLMRAAAVFDRRKDSLSPAAVEFLLALGSGVVSHLVDLYALKEDSAEHEDLMQILRRFPAETAREAAHRLTDPRPAVVRNLLILLEQMGGTESIPFLQGLLRHPDQSVQRVALSILLNLKDPQAIGYLESLLRDKRPGKLRGAIRLVGDLETPEAVAPLLSLLKGRCLSRSDYAVNLEVVQALGRFGDPRALPALERIVRQGWGLYPSELARLKQAVFESLERYPAAGRAALLTAGRHSRDPEIRKICQHISSRGPEA